MNTAKGLLMAMMEPRPELEEDFNRWYNEQHIPERMSVPGFLSARRFRAIEGSPRYLALYDLASPDVLQTPEYLHWLEQGESSWTKRTLARLLELRRNVYEEIPIVGSVGVIRR